MDYSLLVGLHSIRKGNSGACPFTVMEPSEGVVTKFRKSTVMNEQAPQELFKEYN
jgi:hypothetical protein